MSPPVDRISLCALIMLAKAFVLDELEQRLGSQWRSIRARARPRQSAASLFNSCFRSVFHQTPVWCCSGLPAPK